MRGEKSTVRLRVVQGFTVWDRAGLGRGEMDGWMGHKPRGREKPGFDRECLRCGLIGVARAESASD